MATHSDSLFLEITGQIKNRFYMGTSGKIGIKMALGKVILFKYKI